MIFTAKEQQHLVIEHPNQQICAMSDAVENSDIIFHKISNKTGNPRIISPKSARKYMGYESFCEGIAHAYLYGRRCLINHNTGAKVVFINLKEPYFKQIKKED